MPKSTCSKKNTLPINNATINNTNIPEKNYISTLNEFEKSCLPLTDLKNNSINTRIENFVNVVRAFGMDSSAVKLRMVVKVFENLEHQYSEIINYSHSRYSQKDKSLVNSTTPAIFQSLHKGIQILRIFHEFCGMHDIIDKQTANLFLEMTKRNGCSFMGVYVEAQFFKSMQDLCQDFGTPNKSNKEICSVTISYRSSKERLDKINSKDVAQAHIEIKNFLDNWNLFLDKVVVFIIKNYLRLRDQNSSLCFQVFLSQQYQLAAEFHENYLEFQKKLEAEKQKNSAGLIWN